MDETLLSFEDAYEIASKVVDMAERVREIDKITPGARATWGMEMDGAKYRVIVEVQHG